MSLVLGKWLREKARKMRVAGPKSNSSSRGPKTFAFIYLLDAQQNTDVHKKIGSETRAKKKVGKQKFWIGRRKI